MAKSQRSIIPPEKQIPVMIVSAILFAVILWWRFAPQKSVALSPMDLVPVSTAAGDSGTVTELNDALGEMASLNAAPPSWPEWRTEVARDPFHWSVVDAVASTPGEPQTESVSGPQHADLSLRGVLMDARGGLALINGKYVREGDSVEGCLVRSVGETSVTVEDISGIRTLYLPENGPK